jgi:hypothetical protein
MALPERYNLTIYAGATLKRWYRLVYPAGTVVDLEAVGYDTGRLTIRDTYGGDAIVELTTDNGGVSVVQEADATGTEWSGYINMSAASTAALEDWGDGVYDFEVDNGSDVIRVMQGTAVLSPEATT